MATGTTVVGAGLFRPIYMSINYLCQCSKPKYIELPERYFIPAPERYLKQVTKTQKSIFCSES